MRRLALAALVACGGAGAEVRELILEQPNLLGDATRLGRGIESIRPIQLDLPALEAPEFSTRLEPGLVLRVKRDRVLQRPEGKYLFGSTQAGDTAILVIENQQVTGAIRTRTAFYEIEPRPGGHTITRRGWNNLPPEHPPDFEVLRKNPGPRPTKTSSGTSVIRVLAVASKAIRKSNRQIKKRVQMALDELNVFANTGSLVRIQYELDSVIDGKDFVEEQLDEALLKALISKTDGVLDHVHADRNARKADVVVLLLDCSKCPADGSRGIAPVMAGETTAFAIVTYQYAHANLTLGHELGHLLGARHEMAADDEDSPYAYGHGHQFSDWRTIMATGCPDPIDPEQDRCPRLPRWSSPKHWKTPAEADVARALNESAAELASFR